MALSSKVQKSVKKINVNQQTSDFAFWQTQPYELRLATLEQIRQEYHRWKYGTEPGFQRVYSIVKRTLCSFPNTETGQYSKRKWAGQAASNTAISKAGRRI